MEHQPLSGLMTTREIIALVRLSRTSIYRMTRQGRFPPPCSVGNGKIRWREDDVRAWMEGLPVCNYALSAQLEQNNAAAKVIGRHHG